LGQHAIGTTEVTFTDVRVSNTALLGQLDHGWAVCEDTLRYERLCLSAVRIGAARRAFEYALDYAKTRHQFGKPISSFQVTQHKFADMKVMLDTSFTMIRRYAWLMENGKAERADTAVIKYYIGESYKTIADMCLQILGGYGYSMEYPMQRFFRDSRLATIGGGTSEIQKKQVLVEIQSLLNDFLEEVKINYIQRLSQEDIDKILEETRKMRTESSSSLSIRK
jgi:alkylation response protein AidB-like acyl-CoA dehydrogenase